MAPPLPNASRAIRIKSLLLRKLNGTGIPSVKIKTDDVFWGRYTVQRSIQVNTMLDHFTLLIWISKRCFMPSPVASLGWEHLQSYRGARLCIIKANNSVVRWCGRIKNYVLEHRISGNRYAVFCRGIAYIVLQSATPNKQKQAVATIKELTPGRFKRQQRRIGLDKFMWFWCNCWSNGARDIIKVWFVKFDLLRKVNKAMKRWGSWDFWNTSISK